jgi:DNA (cytosine-5)-methyltransferase 1
MSGKPTVISTFAGTGGSSLGYHWAGYRELLAIDWEDHAVECFRLNFPEVPCWQRDITTVTASEILEFTGLKVGELDVFDGSPPCQGFSTAGKRQVNDPRNRLFEAYVQLVHELQPKVFVMENVTGMAKGSMKGKFIEIMKVLKTLNYEVRARQMNALYYGVPQSRERVIFMGIRKDLGMIPSFPTPSMNKNIISDIQKICPDVVATKSDRRNPWMPISKGICTITKTEYPDIFRTRLGIRSAQLDEIKQLCSFPKDWKLPGSKTQAWARLGNAVMPKFMQAIAETIKIEILGKIDS